MPRSLKSDFPARLVVTLAIRGYLVGFKEVNMMKGGHSQHFKVHEKISCLHDLHSYNRVLTKR